MALIFWDGLDNYDSWSSFLAARPISTFFAYTWNSTAGRYGGSTFQLNSAQTDPINGCWYYNNTSLGNEIWVGRAVYTGAIATDLWLSGYGPNVLNSVAVGSADADIVVQSDAVGTISIWRGRGSRYTGSTLLANTAPGVFKASRWQWLETRFRVHPTTGTVEVWLDNQQVLSYTGNTKNSAATTANSISCLFQGGMLYSVGSNILWFDDIYILDTTGPAPWNTRLGDCRIANIVPVADVPGANTGTQSTGTTHWGVVDEIPPNNTDFITLPAAAGNLERFRASNVSSNIANIYGIQVYSRIQKSDAGIANVVFNVIANGTTFVSNSNTDILSTSWVTQSEWITTNPQTGQPWTAANIAGLQIGLTTVA